MTEQIYELTDDYCVQEDIVTSIAFEVDGRPFYILSKDEPLEESFYQLRRELLTNHWIEVFEPTPCGHYRCLIRGTDGEQKWYRFTPAAIEHNFQMVQAGLRADHVTPVAKPDNNSGGFRIFVG